MRWMPTRQGWLTLMVALAYGASPLDLIPDAVPMLGLLDDMGVMGLAVAVSLWWARRTPAELEGPVPE